MRPDSRGGIATKPRQASTLAIAAGFLVALGYSIWLLSPRFGISGPSVIDDWNGASRPGRSLVDLVAPFVEAPSLRFRPGFDLFDHLEWHTFGAPADMTGPNLWNVVRVGLLVAAVGLVPALLARAARPALSPLALAALAALAPALVITGSPTAIDLARLAPQEPMLVGASVCGAALVLFGLDRLMTGGSRPAAAVALALGWPLFVLGATFKEASMALLLAAPFAYLFLVRRWRERGAIATRLEPLRRPAFLACAAALTLPLLWVAFRAATIGEEGADLYQAGAPSGVGGWADRLRDAWNLQWTHMTGTLGTPLWRGLALGTPFLALAVALDRRRPPWLAVGLGLAALGMLIVQGLPAVVTSRYFLPTTALLTIGAALLLAQARAWLRWTALVAAAIVVVGGAGGARDAVQAWATGEEQTSTFVAELAELAERGCRLHAASLDVERAEALPRLVALEMDGIANGCPVDDTALVATLVGADPASVGRTGLWAACREPWRQRSTSGMWLLLSCDELAPRVDGEPTATALRRARLIPGVGALTRADCLEGGTESRACDRPALDRAGMWPDD